MGFIVIIIIMIMMIIINCFVLHCNFGEKHKKTIAPADMKHRGRGDVKRSCCTVTREKKNI